MVAASPSCLKRRTQKKRGGWLAAGRVLELQGQTQWFHSLVPWKCAQARVFWGKHHVAIASVGVLWVTGGNSGALGGHYSGSMSSWRWLLGNQKTTSSSAIECLVITLSVLQSWWWWRIQAPFLWHICRALARVMRNPQDMQTPWCTTIKQSSSPLFEIVWTIPNWTFSSTCAYPSLEIHAQYAGDGVLRRDEAPCDSVAVALEVQ